MDQPTPTAPMSGRVQPARADVIQRDRFRIVESPLLASLLTRIRDRRTHPAEFTRFVGTVGSILILEGCRAARLRATEVPGFDGAPIVVQELAERVAAVVVLRAGLAFADPFREMLPEGAIYQIGAHRNESTLTASIYADNIPARPGWADRVLLLDPMLATGGSAVVALHRIRQSHAGPLTLVSLVAAPLGVVTVLDADPDCDIVAATLDERLDENGYIRPGLGDAGDRTFGTIP